MPVGFAGRRVPRASPLQEIARASAGGGDGLVGVRSWRAPASALAAGNTTCRGRAAARRSRCPTSPTCPACRWPGTPGARPPPRSSATDFAPAGLSASSRRRIRRTSRAQPRAPSPDHRWRGRRRRQPGPRQRPQRAGGDRPRAGRRQRPRHRRHPGRRVRRRSRRRQPRAGAGDDRLDGGPGDDTLDGGAGSDRCSGATARAPGRVRRPHRDLAIDLDGTRDEAPSGRTT